MEREVLMKPDSGRTSRAFWKTEEAIVRQGIRVFRNADLSLPSGTVTEVPLTTVEFNDDPTIYSITASGRIKVVRAVGVFMVAFSGNFVGGSSGARNIQITKNSTSATSDVAARIREVGLVGIGARPGGAGVIRLEEGDEIGMTAYVDGGTAVIMRGTTNPKDVGIDLIRMGP